MNLTESKAFSVAALGLFSFLVGILPNHYARAGRREWPLILSCLLCFGGGVLLSTSLIQILPKLRESVPANYRDYTEIIYCGGFFVLYLIDEIVHFFYETTEEEPLSSFHNHNHNHHNHNHQNHNHQNHNHNHHNQYHHNYSHGNNSQNHLNRSYGSTTETEQNTMLQSEATENKIQEPRRDLTQSLPAELTSPKTPLIKRTQSDGVLVCSEPPSQLCHVSHQEPCNVAPTTNVGLLSALSVHALIEGLVVGLESVPSRVLLLLGAIATHKLVVSFCLGMELASSPSISTKRHYVYILIFAAGSAGGICIGMLISGIPGGLKNVVIPILQALAGGTLLYVTVSEVLPRERARWHQQHEKKSAGMFQFCSVITGFGLMTLLSRFLDY